MLSALEFLYLHDPHLYIVYPFCVTWLSICFNQRYLVEWQHLEYICTYPNQTNRRMDADVLLKLIYISVCKKRGDIRRSNPSSAHSSDATNLSVTLMHLSFSLLSLSVSNIFSNSSSWNIYCWFYTVIQPYVRRLLQI